MVVTDLAGDAGVSDLVGDAGVTDLVGDAGVLNGDFHLRLDGAGMCFSDADDLRVTDGADGAVAAGNRHVDVGAVRAVKTTASIE